MKQLILPMAICMVLGLCGCFPEAIIWSPDGKQALIAKQSYLCDADGKLTRLTTPVTHLTQWFPDSKRIVVAVPASLREWEKFAPLLPEKEKKRLTELAEQFRRQILKSDKGDPSKLPAVQGLSRDDLIVMRIYLRDCHPDGLAEKLGDRWRDFVEASKTVFMIVLAKVDGGSITTGPVVAKLWRGKIRNIRLSRTGHAIAYTVDNPASNEGELSDLFVVPVEGGGCPRLVNKGTGWYMDWSVDNRHLVYAVKTKTNGNDVQLGSIVRKKVCGLDGRLLKKFGGNLDMVGILFDPWGGIRCLSDGRILFSTLEVHLPSRPADMPQQRSLFAINPGKIATVMRILPRSAERSVPDLVQFFRVSPDGTKLSIPGEKGRVAVMIMATGQVTMIVDKPWYNGNNVMVPVWRSSDELCLMVPPGSEYGSAKRAEVILWSTPKKYRCISKDWPDDLIKALLK